MLKLPLLVKDETSVDVLTFTEIHKIFKDWFSDNYTTSIPTTKDLIKQIRKKFKGPNITQTGLKGYSFKASLEEEEEYAFEN